MCHAASVPYLYLMGENFSHFTYHHFKYEDRCKNEKLKTNNLGFRPGPTQTDLQSQKMARGLKFWIKKVEELYYLSSENKGAGQLRSNSSSAPSFSPMQIVGFIMQWLNSCFRNVIRIRRSFVTNTSNLPCWSSFQVTAILKSERKQRIVMKLLLTPPPTSPDEESNYATLL